jgi:hypothetical protein
MATVSVMIPFTHYCLNRRLQRGVFAPESSDCFLVLEEAIRCLDCGTMERPILAVDSTG